MDCRNRLIVTSKTCTPRPLGIAYELIVLCKNKFNGTWLIPVKIKTTATSLIPLKLRCAGSHTLELPTNALPLQYVSITLKIKVDNLFAIKPSNSICCKHLHSLSDCACRLQTRFSFINISISDNNIVSHQNGVNLIKPEQYVFSIRIHSG